MNPQYPQTLDWRRADAAGIDMSTSSRYRLRRVVIAGGSGPIVEDGTTVPGEVRITGRWDGT